MEFAKIGMPFWKEAAVDHKIDVRVAPASESLDLMIKNGETFDMIFIDADKEGYLEYFKKSLKVLKKNGIVAVDNCISQSVLLAQLRCLLTVCRRSCKPHSSLLIHVPTCRSTFGKITVLRTHHEAIVNWLLRITNITLQHTSPPVHSYLAAPNNSCRGVIRGIASEATPDEIINDLESYQGDILHARQVGTTGSAIITFIGTHVPYTVYYRRLEFRCRPHKPRAHRCNSCVEYGHRTLACPGNQRRCPPCSTTLARPDEPHPCTPWFALLQLAVWFSNRAFGPE
ncbi:hypothetical protein ISCGN_010310 [Ixodes scapularis]